MEKILAGTLISFRFVSNGVAQIDLKALDNAACQRQYPTNRSGKHQGNRSPAATHRATPLDAIPAKL